MKNKTFTFYRVKRVLANLTLGIGTEPNNRRDTAFVRKYGGHDFDVAGHVIAKEFGGPADIYRGNIIPQGSFSNSGRQATIENPRFGYCLTENRGEGIVHAFYGFAFGEKGHVQIAIYFDNVSELELARGLWRSLE